ncbi:RNA polymerase I enhancer binding protein [Mortierella sp. NVP85]|nr:RNA polymerase I enhancer binding protein [Mortierella sp. NVP85]
MENQSESPRKRKNSEEALNANFKKALVSPIGSSDVYGDFNILGSNQSSSHGNTSVRAESTPPHRPETTSVVNHDSISDLSLNHASAAANASSVEAASAAVMTTMADLLANAGDMAHSARTRQNDHDRHQHQEQSDVAGVSDEVLRMQQMPLSPSSNTQITREQLLESIANPTVRMILEETLKGNLVSGNNDSSSSTEQQHHHHHHHSSSQSATVDATAVLMNLGDPSILATLKPTLHPTGPSQNEGDSARSVSREGAQDDSGTESQNSEAGSSRKGINPPMNDPGAVTSDNPLHTKWLMATALKEKRIPYKTGTFSSHEDELIRQTIKDYVARNNMPEDAIQRWFENGNGRGRFEKNDLKALWVEIAVRLQTRPLLNIYLHVRRMFHPQNNVGAWSKDDDKKLIELYGKYRGQWTTIGNELGRMADSCRDRYRNHLKDQSTMITGPWQPHEDEKLLTIMQELALQQGKANILDSSPMWTLISERMEGTRTRHQCRHRYSQTLQPRLERGEWTAPSSAAAAAAAAVAANAAAAVEAKQVSLHVSDGLGLGTNSDHNAGKGPATEDVLMLAAALQGVLPNNGNNNMLWSQPISTDMQGISHSNMSSNGDNHGSGEIHHAEENHDDYAPAYADNIPMPSIVPKAPKGPIRRRSGLQQQLDVLRMIQEDAYTDHTDIKWADIAQRLRDRVEEANEIQLARIIQSHQKLDIKKQQHLQHGNSAAIATAAASAAMAAALSAAQAEAVASLQRIPAANQIARTFMSSRCKIEGYKEMTLQQVIIPMMKDVERRIQQRRRGSSKSSSTNGSESPNESGEEASSTNMARRPPSAKRPTTTALLQQQEINNAAQQAAIAALSAQFPYLHHHQQQQQHAALTQALTGTSASSSAMHSHADHQHAERGERDEEEHYDEDHDRTVSRSSDHPPHSSEPSGHAMAPSHGHELTVEEQAQHQHELEQQQHNHDLAEQMLHLLFLEALSSVPSDPNDLALLDEARKQKEATTVLEALRSSATTIDQGLESGEDDDRSLGQEDG